MNFNALVSAIQSELNDYSSRTKTRIEKWVNEGHRSICQKRNWRFLIVRESDEMTFLGTDFPINLDTDIEVSSSGVAVHKILALWNVTTGSREPVIQATADDIKDMYSTEYNSTDALYWSYVSDQKINVFPLPSDTDSVDLIFSFQKKISTYATGSTDALLIPDEYIDVLQEYVLYKAYRYKTDDRAGSCLENYKELYQAMVDSESNKDPIIYDRPEKRFYKFPMLVDIS